MSPRRLLSCLLPGVLAVALLLPACGGGGRKGQREVLLRTRYDDARVGREASKDVSAEMGILDDEALNAYVNEIGRKLLRGMPRRPFRYEFHVVDQFEPNAFALPGGYIFISRGLLALANNEDELACVIGHEITHAAHRHAAARQEMVRRTNPLSMPWHRAGSIAAYGRDMERDADRGGQLLAAAAGYDPMGMSTFLASMAQMERYLIGHSRVPTFLDTHPGAKERAATNAARAREIRWKRDPSLGDTHASYLRRVQGLQVGQRPEGGVFEGSRFLHPDLDFQVMFPRGWRTQNTNRVVAAVEPRGNAFVFLMADQPAGEPREVAQRFAEKTQEESPVTIKGSQPVKIGELDGWRLHLEGGGGLMSVAAYVTFIPYRGATWRITGVSRARDAQRFIGRTLNTARSFRPLTEQERNSVEDTRLHLVKASRGESLKVLARRTQSAWDAGRMAIYNGVFVNHRFKGGELVKVAKKEPYAPEREHRDAVPAPYCPERRAQP